MIWSGFRPSDDPVTYHYNIPGNMLAASALERLLLLNSRVWQRWVGTPSWSAGVGPVSDLRVACGSESLEKEASALLKDVQAGISKWGIVDSPDGKVYAYEVRPQHKQGSQGLEVGYLRPAAVAGCAMQVDGLGKALVDFDDPNVPSLLSIPLLGYS
jgi:uncharacterized protein